jgi:hypothetical protein
LPVERRDDPNGQLRGATPVDESEQFVQVEDGRPSNASREPRLEAGAPKRRTSPAFDVGTGLDVDLHTDLAAHRQEFLPRPATATFCRSRASRSVQIV